MADAPRKLVDRAVLKTVDQTYNNETYLPRATAFYYCGRSEALQLARKSTDNVLKILQVLYDRELDKGPPEQRQFSPSDVEAEAHKLELNVDSKMVRLGLYFADELSVFPSMRKDDKQVFPVSFGLGEYIYEIMKDENPWQSHFRRGRTNVENPYRLLDRIEFPEQPQDITDLPKKEKLIADVGSFLMRKAGIALLVMDLDGFKSVNDTKGHPEGDTWRYT